MDSEKKGKIQPRIIIHGGAGNITRENLPSKAYNTYREALLQILDAANAQLHRPGTSALDVATYAVTLLENNGLFNSGHGAVYTTAGTHELEASVMVSRGYRKRGVGIMNVRRAKNPILVAREMLIRGEQENGGGAQGHCQLQGAEVDQLAKEWGLETVSPSYYWTRRRWDEHRRGLGKKHDDETYKRHRRKAAEGGEQSGVDNAHDAFDESGWDGKEYLPQGTVGAVVLDSFGTVCCATSTGGLTNKLPGRIGDTPTLGAGFWAEEWLSTESIVRSGSLVDTTSPASLAALVNDCLPSFSGYMKMLAPTPRSGEIKKVKSIRAVGMSGTGNGDSFLRISAVRTAGALAQFRHDIPNKQTGHPQPISLQSAVTDVAGPNGLLQQSAEDRWHKTGEGEGGIIGIDFAAGKGHVVFDYNCGGMFHAWIDDNGKARFQVFRDQIDVKTKESNNTVISILNE